MREPWLCTLACRTAVIAAILGMSFAASPVSAGGEFTTGRLREVCNENQGSLGRGYCSGFIYGAALVLFTNGKLVDENKNPVATNSVSICLVNVSSGAMEQAFMDWAGRNPKDWDKPAVIGVITALHETWPCK
jgi:hypothetical protein